MNQTFLVEIGTEELPSKYIHKIIFSLKEKIKEQLKKNYFSYKSLFYYATPRRLAIKIVHIHFTREYNSLINSKKFCNKIQSFQQNFLNNQKEKYFSRKKISSLDLNNENIYKKNDIKFDIKESLFLIFKKTLKKISIPESMRWGVGKTYFIRPIRTFTMLLNHQLIDGEIHGIKNKRFILGHRFIGKRKIKINFADEYPNILFNHGKVIADYQQRKDTIVKQLKNKIKQINGVIKISSSLLEEITYLVEWPVILIGQFDKFFLSLPKEIIVTIMEKNLRYFPIYNNKNQLMPYFAFVSNIDSIKPQEIIIGNEKVINARFLDINFFLKKDLNLSLEKYLPFLKKITFHKKLGSLYDKTKRLELFSSFIANYINGNVFYAQRAALLSKCDLATSMVFEMPHLQGVVGMYYAAHNKEKKEIAIAIKEHYQPYFHGDHVPNYKTSDILAITDKIDTLVGIIGTNSNNEIKSDKDPFGLRRLAFGILSIIIKKKYDLDLSILIDKSIKLYQNKLNNTETKKKVLNFLLKKINSWYIARGYNKNVIKSVLNVSPTNMIDIDIKINTITYFKKNKLMQNIIKIYKRIFNILQKNNIELNNNIDFNQLIYNEEIELASKVVYLEKISIPLFSYRKYKKILINMLELEKSIELFFQNVIILDKNDKLKKNRLTILYKIHNLFFKITNFSLLL
ncbi:MAG: glycine--tRNA ligase subunit beta [Arsenophonus sp.]|nr:MAG: glycine--tRNA ligase subunit beta [Arsenophonus sp.]